MSAACRQGFSRDCVNDNACPENYDAIFIFFFYFKEYGWHNGNVVSENYNAILTFFFLISK